MGREERVGRRAVGTPMSLLEPLIPGFISSHEPYWARAGTQHVSKQEGAQQNQKYAGLCQIQPKAFSTVHFYE